MIEHEKIKERIETLLNQRGFTGLCDVESNEGEVTAGFIFADGSRSPIRVGYVVGSQRRTTEEFARLAASRFAQVAA